MFGKPPKGIFLRATRRRRSMFQKATDCFGSPIGFGGCYW